MCTHVDLEVDDDDGVVVCDPEAVPVCVVVYVAVIDADGDCVCDIDDVPVLVTVAVVDGDAPSVKDVVMVAVILGV